MMISVGVSFAFLIGSPVTMVGVSLHLCFTGLGLHRIFFWMQPRILVAAAWRMGAKAVIEFFDRNRATIDREHLAAALACIIRFGPSKTVRVPLLAGVTNAGKSTVLDPIDFVFGSRAVMHTPALCATMPLANLALASKRFIYFDEFFPVEYAAIPDRAPTIPAVTFKKLFSGQALEVQTSQCFNNGNEDVKWSRGAAITAPLENLWVPQGRCTAEDIRHMKSRVLQFDALVPIQGELKQVPLCPESWCKYVVDTSAAYAARMPYALPPPAGQAEEPDAGQEGPEHGDNVFFL